MTTYSIWTGIYKTLKNGLIFWTPALVAFLTNVPPTYSVIASAILYFLKNYVENKNK